MKNGFLKMARHDKLWSFSMKSYANLLDIK